MAIGWRFPRPWLSGGGLPADPNPAMASKSKIHVDDDKSLLDKLLRSPLPLDTDGLPGLVHAPVVYDLILRDLHQDGVWMSVQAITDPKANRDGAPRKTR